MKPPFLVHKLSGAGNTFALCRGGAELDRVLAESKLTRASLAERLCGGGRGLGTDGALFLEAEGEDRFRWDFYNSDGSPAEMCGNAARCAGRFVHDVIGLDRARAISFETPAGPVVARRNEDGLYTVDMPPVTVHQRAMVLIVDGESLEGGWIDSGVPHFVTKVRDLGERTASLCRRLRFHPDLGGPGANVTLLKPTGRSEGEAVTYERGVENFTAACGTGAVAAAWVLSEGRGSAVVRMPGGALEVSFGGPRPLLTGPTRLLGEYRPDAEFFE